MRTFRLFGSSIVAAALSFACTSSGSPTLPTVPPTASPTVEASPTPDGWAHAPDAAHLARQLLAQQLRLETDTVGLISAEEVEWRDGCLGVSIPGILCAQVITPGYKVVLKAGGATYEYHTDSTGGRMVLAAAPEPDIPNPAVVWMHDEGGCRAATIGGGKVAFGVCGGPMMTGLLIPDVDRPRQLDDFVQTYASFQADTPAGRVTFTGEGSTSAAPAEQRMIAEWARLAQQEAVAGRSGASWGLAIGWHREGGIAGFCDDLGVFVTGVVQAASCKGGQSNDRGQARLSAGQLEQLFDWIDDLMPFEIDETDPATADAMTIRMVFAGEGEREPSKAERQAVQNFAAQLFAATAR